MPPAPPKFADSQNWNDPWPPPQPAWCDPPWALTGRSVTAWFSAPRDAVAATLSPDLLPDGDNVRVRFRFYDLAFRAEGPAASQPLAPRTGRFREAAFGVPAVCGAITGETSTYLWTDSVTYLTWGREAFGWPLAMGQIELSGTLWDAEYEIGPSSTGTAKLEDGWGSAALDDIQLGTTAGEVPGSVNWFTPRRTIRRAGLDPEERELLVVRPVIRQPGARLLGEATLDLSFREPHPLAALQGGKVEIDVADEFELLIGADVDVMSKSTSSKAVAPR